MFSGSEFRRDPYPIYARHDDANGTKSSRNPNST